MCYKVSYRENYDMNFWKVFFPPILLCKTLKMISLVSGASHQRKTSKGRHSACFLAAKMFHVQNALKRSRSTYSQGMSIYSVKALVNSNSSWPDYWHLGKQWGRWTEEIKWVQQIWDTCQGGEWKTTVGHIYLRLNPFLARWIKTGTFSHLKEWSWGSAVKK